MHAISSYHGNRPTHKQTHAHKHKQIHRWDRLQYTALQLACTVLTTAVTMATTKHLDCLLRLYWSGLTLLNGFSFLVIFFSSFSFGSCSRLSWLNCQLSSAHSYIASLLTYLMKATATTTTYHHRHHDQLQHYSSL